MEEPPKKPTPQWYRVLRKWCKFYGNQIKDIFAYIDSDKDGVINRTELRRAMIEIDPDQFQEGDVDVFFECADLNGDGVIDYAEFVLKLVSLLLEYNPKHVSWSELHRKWERFNTVKLKEVFNHLDQNKDGVIDRADLKVALFQLGDTYTEDELDKLIKDSDTNKDGVIDYTEFTTKLSEALVNFHKAKQDPTTSTLDFDDEDHMRKLFKKMDTDRDGTITSADFCRILEEMDPSNFVREDAEVLFELADVNENGTIDYEEFKEHLMESLRKYTMKEK